MNFTQDFMAGNKGLQSILTTWGGIYLSGVKDSTFKMSKLKSDWNTYFTELKSLIITEEHWNHEDLSALKKLSIVSVSAGTTDHLNNGGTVIPIPVSVIDNVIIQVAAGAGQTVNNGFINFFTGGTVRSSASDTAYNLLISKGWTFNYF